MRIKIGLLFFVIALSMWAVRWSSISAQVVIPLDDGFVVIPLKGQQGAKLVYFNDFSTLADGRRIDQFVAYRDPFVVNHTIGRSDHAPTGGINCTAPEVTRTQTRQNPYAHVYQCLPGSNADLGHQMAFAMDTSGYGFVGALPNQVYEGLTEVSVDINTTNAGSRNFIEIKIIPADRVYINGMPCIPDLPCNDGWDYDDIGAVGAATHSQEGTGLKIATPDRPDGFRFDQFNSISLANGDIQYLPCAASGFCFNVWTHEDSLDVRQRYQHVFRDNGDGTLSFGIENAQGSFDWVRAPGAFPKGPLRVVIAFHNYTGTKDGDGPGANGNVSPSKGGMTWHWDDLAIIAEKATPSLEYYGGLNAERIVTADNCIAFSQGQRSLSSNTDIAPGFHCASDADLDL